MLGLCSRIRPYLTVESANHIYKVMELSVLDHCDIIFHEIKMTWKYYTQRRASKIVYQSLSLYKVTSSNAQNVHFFTREQKFIAIRNIDIHKYLFS